MNEPTFTKSTLEIKESDEVKEYAVADLLEEVSEEEGAKRLEKAIAEQMAEIEHEYDIGGEG